MNYRALRIVLFAICVITAAVAVRAGAAKIPTVVTPRSVKWHRTAFAGVYVATIDVEKNARGAHVTLVRIESGVRVPPHTHPGGHLTTVLSGTFYLGSGTRFDASKMRALKPGTAILIPANTPRYVWAKDGEVIVEQVGFGPEGIAVIHHSHDRELSPSRPVRRPELRSSRSS